MTPYREIGTLLKNKIYKTATGRESYKVSSLPFKQIKQIELNKVLGDICHKRHERRQVLFALGKTGGNHKPPKYTKESLVRC